MNTFFFPDNNKQISSFETVRYNVFEINEHSKERDWGSKRGIGIKGVEIWDHKTGDIGIRNQAVKNGVYTRCDWYYVNRIPPMLPLYSRNSCSCFPRTLHVSPGVRFLWPSRNVAPYNYVNTPAIIKCLKWGSLLFLVITNRFLRIACLYNHSCRVFLSSGTFCKGKNGR